MKLHADSPDAWNPTAAPRLLPEYARTGLPAGASLVITDELRLLIAFASRAATGGDVVVVSGESGLGKTTMAGAVEAVATVRVARAEMQPRVRDKQVWRELALAVLGHVPAGTADQLRLAIKARLMSQPTLLFVDDAHNVGLNCLLQLRWLHAATNRGFGLVLVGVNLDEYLNREKQLRTRVTRRILVPQPDFTVLRPQLAQFHPILAGIGPRLLSWVNDVYCRNNWYEWSTYTQAVNSLRVTGRLTPENAATALKMTTGRELDVPPDVAAEEEQRQYDELDRRAS
jgi:hypothetical protein